ncbi:hypothetical protein TNCV_1828231 [Trichonephila clavipes]|nr:hypothetical protein TNCV_1828231 [Trichonephila clavipes]
MLPGEFDIAHSVVSRLWKSFKTTGMCSRRHGGGRVRNTTPAEDRYIVLSAKMNRRTTTQQVANQFLAASGKQISRKTVARRLRGEDYTQTCCVCPIDQTAPYCPFAMVPKYPGKGPISDMQYHGVGQHHDQWPHAPTCGCEWTMTGQLYIDEVLLPHDCLDSEGIQRLVWPARSPDLNPIENVWDALGRQVAGRNYPRTNKNTLIRALTEEWDKLPQQLLDNVVQSMVRRVECCITLHGGHIRTDTFL